MNLDKIQKAARYVGGEYNQPDMKKGREVNYCMCFPDLYEVAMSNLGIRILYDIINKHPLAVCERCFTPAPDMAEEMLFSGKGLFSLETAKGLKEFDLIGFSFQYELSYSNFLYMLDLAKIPPLASHRGEEYPIVMGGGPCMVNPMPVADFLDLVVIGDGEDVIASLIELYAKNKRNGGKKKDYLLAAAKLTGVYVPSLKQKKVKKATVADLDAAAFPTAPLVPNIEIAHDRAVLELFRGCSRGCRFCQAGFIYRPVRRRSVEKLEELSREIIKNTGYDELSLSSLSTGDYPYLKELSFALDKQAHDMCFSVSLPSLRMDSFDAEMTLNARRSSLTFAPEAGTQRLRNVINKNITQENITATLSAAFDAGYNSIKLYFMIGLPTETITDIEGIVSLAKSVKDIYYAKKRGKGLRLNCSASVFIPKPFTPFEREEFLSGEVTKQRQDYLKENLKKIGVTFSYHDYDTSLIEAAFARGGRELSSVLLAAYKNGAKMDGWSEHFKASYYLDAFASCNVNINKYLKGFLPDEVLAWDFIDLGVKQEYLKKECERAKRAETTADCQKECGGCGAC